MDCQVFSEKFDKDVRGIWKFHRFFGGDIPADKRLTIGEGETELEPIEIQGKKIWLKREDTNPNGSHKDRSLAYQVSVAAADGLRELVLSSSGNAAISAADFCRRARIKLWVFLSPDANRRKFLAVKRNKPEIIISRRARRLANYIASKKKILNLRPSLDDNSVIGFKSIGYELFEEFPEIMPIFTYVTSGSSYLGIYEAFHDLEKLGCISKLPPLNDVTSMSDGLAGRGGTKKSRRLPEVEAARATTGGQKQIMNDDEIREAENILREHNIEASTEGQASFAAAMRSESPECVCILTGKDRSDERLQPGDLGGITRAESLSEIDQILES